MITFETLPQAVEDLQNELTEIKSLLLEQDRPEPDFPIALNEACKFLHKSRPTIYRNVSERTIPFHKQGGRLYFYKSELSEWIKNQ